MGISSKFISLIKPLYYTVSSPAPSEEEWLISDSSSVVQPEICYISTLYEATHVLYSNILLVWENTVNCSYCTGTSTAVVLYVQNL